MQSQQIYDIDYQYFNTRYKFIRNQSNFQIGNYQLRQDKETKNQVMVKTLQLNPDVQQSEELLHIIEQQQLFNSRQNLVKVFGISKTFNKDDNGEVLTLLLLYQQPQGSLDQAIQYNVKIKKRFSEIFLLNLLLSIINQLIFLKKNNYPFGADITPSDIYIETEKTGSSFQLFYTQFAVSSYERILELGEQAKNFFLSPQQHHYLDLFIQAPLTNKPQLNIDSQKSVVFSLGLLMVKMGLLEKAEKLAFFNIFDNVSSTKFIENSLNELKNSYTPEYCSLIDALLNFEPNLRPDLQETSYIIQQIINFQQIKPQKNSPQKLRNPLEEQNNLPLQNMNKQTPIEQNYLNSKFYVSTYQKILDNYNKPGLDSKDKSTSSSQIRAFSKENYQYALMTPTKQKGIPHHRKTQSTQYSSVTQMTQMSQMRKSSDDIGNSNNTSCFQYSILEQSTNDLQDQIINKKLSSNSRLHRNSSTCILLNESIPTRVSYDYRNSSSPIRSQFIRNDDQVKERQKSYNLNYISEKLEEFKSNYLLDENNKQQEGIIQVIYSDKSQYLGQTQFNMRHGKGLFFFNSGDTYFGDWVCNEFFGQGIYIYSTGELYEGQLKQNRQDGYGIYHYLNGNQYEGIWKNNYKHGQGKYFYCQENEFYIGEYYQGKRNGFGEYHFSNGNIFKGCWKDDKKVSQGQVCFFDGSVFEGEWSENSPEGFGILYYSNGDVYQGNFSCGIQEGDGIYLYNYDRIKYEGKWRNDQPDGFGIISFATGDRYEGEINNGLKEGNGFYIYKNGDQYDGNWENDEQEGYGIMKFRDGSVFEGNWFKGQINGQGKMVYKNGDVYEGEWVENSQHGVGQYIWQNSCVYEGEWFNDQMVKEEQILIQ